ncbi:SRPBCC family protein [Oceanobacillus timonensis]|uniref:SRPBCC family protein n=1 Tax=Oceanobacillus timonensis TaxID=1926285 RepID=UPI0009BAD543|nr:SRPBCC family protein [Oceanobacillus timonensis]
MLATLEQVGNEYIATFERHWENTVEEVWSVLTQNNKLQQWMPNLEVVDLRKNGTMTFHMNDGTGNSFGISILDFQAQSHWQFEWGDESVRFELEAEEEGCKFVLKEYIPILNDHTPKDLAGWHICLDMFQAALNGEPIDFPVESWKAEYEAYKKIVQPFLEEDK